LLDTAGDEQDPAQREFVRERVKQLERWIDRGRIVLPILQKVLGE
jgi:predicted GTPase